MKKIGLLLVLIFGLWTNEGKVYAADNQPTATPAQPTVAVPQTKEVDKDTLIVYLRLLNQKSAITAQLESSMTAQQKQMIDVINSTTKDLQGQIAKLTDSCGKGFVFAEDTTTCKSVIPAPATPIAK